MVTNQLQIAARACAQPHGLCRVWDFHTVVASFLRARLFACMFSKAIHSSSCNRHQMPLRSKSTPRPHQPFAPECRCIKCRNPATTEVRLPTQPGAAASEGGPLDAEVG